MILAYEALQLRQFFVVVLTKKKYNVLETRTRIYRHGLGRKIEKIIDTGIDFNNKSLLCVKTTAPSLVGS